MCAAAPPSLATLCLALAAAASACATAPRPTLTPIAAAAAPAPIIAPPAAAWRVPVQVRRWNEEGIDTLGAYPSALSHLAAGEAWFIEPEALLDAAQLLTLLDDVATWKVAGVSLRGQELPPGWLDRLRPATGLRALDLSETNLGDADLASGALPAGLRRLYLAGTAISDASAPFWATRKSLEVVDLSDTRIGDATTSALRPGRELRALALAGTRVSDASAAALAELTSLVVLDLARTRTGQLTAAAVAHLPLRELYLADTDAAAAAAKLAPLAATLVRLDLSGSPVRDEQLAWLPRARALRALYLGDTLAGDATVRLLATLGGLRVLELAAVPASAPALAALTAPSALPSLEDLDLADTAAGDSIAAALLARPRLHRLRLDGAKISDAGMRAAPPALRQLFLSRTTVGDAGLAALGPLRDLAVLALADTPISGASAERIARMGGLRTLVLDGVRWNSEAFAALGSLLALEALHLERTALSDESLRALATMRQLRALHLQDTNITDEGLAAFAYADPASAAGPADRATLEVLTLGNTSITDPVAAVAPWPALRTLSLYGLPVEDRALRLLVVKHPRLQLLNLGATDIADPSPLADLPQLRSLGLLETRLTDRSFAGLARAPRLAELSIANCNVGHAAAADLARLPALQRLDLRGTPLAVPPPTGADPLLPLIRRGVILERAGSDGR